MNFNQAPDVPERPKWPRRAAKGSPRAQREPKGSKMSQKEPKVGPGGAKGTRSSQSKPKGKDIYQKTPDQPPKRTLCYKCQQSASLRVVSAHRFPAWVKTLPPVGISVKALCVCICICMYVFIYIYGADWNSTYGGNMEEHMSFMPFVMPLLPYSFYHTILNLYLLLYLAHIFYTHVF